ncbi:hypothetical protein Tco_1509188 [Tanacetum coccineum]
MAETTLSRDAHSHHYHLLPLLKIPIIRKGEYDIWSMRMRQYICHTDHNLWDIIVNGDLKEEPTPTGETSAPPAPKTAKQLASRRNQERVKSILLLAIPDEYLLKFHNVANAKSLWEAIKSRFGGNEESKKMQKNSIGGSWCSNIKGRYQPEVPKKSSSFMEQIALIMRNKPDIDEIDIDDLYNNLIVIDEDDLKELDLRWQVAMLTVRKMALCRGDADLKDHGKKDLYGANGSEAQAPSK